jgi:hypothetical protein
LVAIQKRNPFYRPFGLLVIYILSEAKVDGAQKTEMIAHQTAGAITVQLAGLFPWKINKVGTRQTKKGPFVALRSGVREEYSTRTEDCVLEDFDDEIDIQVIEDRACGHVLMFAHGCALQLLLSWPAARG